ncbi:MAG: hypothetical protein JSV03_03945 [Planctomycetota bacterium]|nr:MAG: hypothetical protein JSV03_03945 [Planctomycetota bacterium]
MSDHMKIISLATWLTAALAGTAAAAPRHDERIRVYEGNKYYWQYKGKPVLLLGGSDEDNLFNDPEMMMRDLHNLQACGGNYIRCTLSWRDENNVYPYLKQGDKFDLNRFNPEFFERLERCCRECYQRDIIVQPEVWATWDFYVSQWPTNPFNPANNITCTTENTKLQIEWPHMPFVNPQPFFRSVPELNNDVKLLKIQQSFVRKVLDATLKYPNVLYCLDNETRTPEPWALYWAGFLRQEAKKLRYHIEVTEMRGKHDLDHKEHAYLYKHPELFSFTEVSQNNWKSGQLHYDRLIWWRENLKKQKGGPRPMNNVKIYGATKVTGQRDERLNIDRFFKNIFAGCAGARFHRPGNRNGVIIGGLGLNKPAQRAIKAARTFTEAFNIFRCEPRPDLLRDREKDEAYCLVEKGKTYAVYFPKGGEVALKPEGANGQYIMRWFDPVKVEFVDRKQIAIYSKGIHKPIKLTSANNKQAWLVLLQKQ